MVGGENDDKDQNMEEVRDQQGKNKGKTIRGIRAVNNWKRWGKGGGGGGVVGL